MESALRGRVPDGTRLIETFGWTPQVGYRRLDAHLDRMASSARQLGFDFDAAAARACLKAEGDVPLRCRLTLGANGFACTSAHLAPNPEKWMVAISEKKLSSHDLWLGHKTTQRALYDQVRSDLPRGIDEVIFANENNFLCEGTITNIFVTTGSGDCLTPALRHGLLPGILRAEMLSNGQTKEADLTLDDLRNAKTIHLGNALRGLIPAVLA